ncbi:hypothetical protein Fmac_020351 [Flemingia macrophylla]|uniref:Uncharacterized protein n=1 Tax=Flemingia macrophylla TaxID=520843 RepID=A0ABD1LTV2_9FABA
MKASVKFREEQEKPLFRGKVPLSILGMPLESGIVAGDSKELSLNLSTLFEWGPCLKACYRPNDSKNPFSLIVKTGTGPFGSPLASSMLMTCEFALPTPTASPLFMLHFKPRFGDFTFKKTQSSVFDAAKPFAPPNDAVHDASLHSPISLPFLPGQSSVRMLSGVEVAARTTIPVLGRAAVKFRWGVRVPAEVKGGGTALQRIPFLVMDKIGVEHTVDCAGGGGGELKKKKKKAVPQVPAAGDPADVAEACLAVKRQMEVLQAESGLLRSAVEDLRREIVGVRGVGAEFGKGRNPSARKSEKKTTDVEASEELKKALMGNAA